MVADTYDFMRAIIAAPDEDTHRLAFADWLDENATSTPCQRCAERVKTGQLEWGACPQCGYGNNGNPGRVPDGRAARSEFIRVGCELEAACYKDCLPNNHCFKCCPDPSHHDSLRRRERELLRAHGKGWLPLPSNNNFRDNRAGFIVNGAQGEFTFRRGFVAEVSLSAEAFCGGVCPTCRGSAKVHPGAVTYDCYDCRGKGRTPGHAAALFSACPIEKVTLTQIGNLGDRLQLYSDDKPWFLSRLYPRVRFDLVTVNGDEFTIQVSNH